MFFLNECNIENQGKKLTPPEWQSPSTITLSADLLLPADKQKSPKYVFMEIYGGAYL